MTDDLESAITATRRVELRACTADACRQDSRRCPCPSECSVPLEEDDPTVALKDWAKWSVVVAACAVAAYYLVSWLMTINPVSA